MKGSLRTTMSLFAMIYIQYAFIWSLVVSGIADSTTQAPIAELITSLDPELFRKPSTDSTEKPLTTVPLPECQSLFATPSFQARDTCMPYISWVSSRDLSTVMYPSIRPYFQIRNTVDCSLDVPEYRIMLCAMMYSPCSENHNNNDTSVRYPCKKTCFDVLRNCWSLTPMLSCHLLPDDNCLDLAELSKYRGRYTRMNPKKVKVVVDSVRTQHQGDTVQKLDQNDNLEIMKAFISSSAFIQSFKNRIDSDSTEVGEYSKTENYRDLIYLLTKLASMKSNKKIASQSPTMLVDLISALGKLFKTKSKKRERDEKTTGRCISDISTSVDIDIADTCREFVSWNSFRDNSANVSHLIKYFDLKPSYYCSFDVAELNIMLCAHAFPPCMPQDSETVSTLSETGSLTSQNVCRQSCFDTLRNCWPLTTIFKCNSYQNYSCLTSQELNKYRGRYIRQNPPTINMALPIIEPTTITTMMNA